MKSRTAYLIPCCFCLLSFTSLSGQSLIGSGGDSKSGSTYSLSWSLGELSVSTLSSSNFILTQGLHQGIYIEPIPLNAEKSFFKVEVFPNPANDWIQITSEETDVAWSYAILNQEGKEMKVSRNLKDQNRQVDIRDMASGMYFIIVNQPNKSQSFKLIINR